MKLSPAGLIHPLFVVVSAGLWLNPCPLAAQVLPLEPPGQPLPAGQPAPAAESALTPALSWQVRLLATLGEGPIPEEAAPDLLLKCLNSPESPIRLASVALLIDSMTPGNAEAMRRAFGKCTGQTGRRHGHEWKMMMRKFGATLGAAAVLKVKAEEETSALALEGWAAADPEAALAHLDPASPRYARESKAWLTGAAAKDPVKAFSYALSQPNSPINAGELITSAIQSVGIDRVKEGLELAVKSSPPQAIKGKVYAALYQALTEQFIHQTWVAWTSVKVLPWLEAQKGQPLLTEGLMAWAGKNAILQGHIIATLDWLDRMNAGSHRAPLGYTCLFQAYRDRPQELSKMDEPTFKRIVAAMTFQPDQLAALSRLLAPVDAPRAKMIEGILALSR